MIELMFSCKTPFKKDMIANVCLVDSSVLYLKCIDLIHNATSLQSIIDLHSCMDEKLPFILNRHYFQIIFSLKRSGFKKRCLNKFMFIRVHSWFKSLS